MKKLAKSVAFSLVFIPLSMLITITEALAEFHKWFEDKCHRYEEWTFK